MTHSLAHCDRLQRSSGAGSGSGRRGSGRGGSCAQGKERTPQRFAQCRAFLLSARHFACATATFILPLLLLLLLLRRLLLLVTASALSRFKCLCRSVLTTHSSQLHKRREEERKNGQCTSGERDSAKRKQENRRHNV
jgi:hypothetical protein